MAGTQTIEKFCIFDVNCGTWVSQFYKGTQKIPVVGDICDKNRVENVFSEHMPHVVFHAAAHKHVPLMETNGMEAVKNNVFGTKILAEAAAMVMEAGYIGQGGDIYPGDGQTDKDTRSGRDIIKLSGLEPDKDIK